MKTPDSIIRNIWMITREYGEIAGAGGVKDVVAQLSLALAKWSGRRLSVVLPLYGCVDTQNLDVVALEDLLKPGQALRFNVEMNYADEERVEPVSVWKLKIARVNVYFLDSPRFFEKQDVYTYTADEEKKHPGTLRGEGHFDYFAMNLLLQKAALQLMIFLGEKPDVIHCHDGHTAVVPALIAENNWLNSYFRATGCLVTIHNAGMGYHQEVADLPYAQAMTGLPYRVIQKSLLGGSFDPLVSAGNCSLMNTVSENYARELQQSDEDDRTGRLGHHLLDMGLTLEGITNGIDPEIFDPRKGREIGLAAPFDPRDDNLMAGKRLCKRDLLLQLSESTGYEGLEQYGHLAAAEDVPLFTFIGRLSEQKGVDILIEAARILLQGEKDFQLLILGSGTALFENELEEITRLDVGVGRICFLKGYNTDVANRIYSGGDFFLVPSRYEPCGLTDFIAQLFANLPVVHSIGGLVKVKDGETGFAYSGNSPETLVDSMERAVFCYNDKLLLRKMQKQAVNLIEKEYSWSVVMKRYLQLYKKSRLINRVMN